LLILFLNFFKDQHLEKAFIIVYDEYLKTEEGDCGSQDDEWAWARKLADKYKGIELGNPAPDFVIPQKNISLYDLPAKYILLVFGLAGALIALRRYHIFMRRQWISQILLLLQ